MINELAPIAIFVYNRPEHTKKCLEALLKNTQVHQSDVHIFCDGPKANASDEQINAIIEVKKIVLGYKEKLNAQLHFSELNQGCRHSIYSGVTSIIEKYGKIIVVEDDIVVSNTFIKYMNDCLERYKNEPRIMHIGGYTPPIKFREKKGVYLLRYTSVWGWATWEDRWSTYIHSVSEIRAEIDQKNLRSEFDFNNTAHYYKMLIDQEKGLLDTWDIQWNSTVFLKNGLGVHPYKSLVNNIGFDGQGTHCSSGKWFTIKKLNNQDVSIELEKIEEGRAVRKSYEKFYVNIDKMTLWRKIESKVKYEISKARGPSY